MRQRYKKILQHLNSKSPTALDDVALFVKREPDFFAVVKQIQFERTVTRQTQEFERNVHMTVNDVDRYLGDLREKKLLVQEEIFNFEKAKALNPKSIKYKQGRLQNLQKRLENIEVTESALSKLSRDLATRKRPVGRPRKTEEQTNDEE